MNLYTSNNNIKSTIAEITTKKSKSNPEPKLYCTDPPIVHPVPESGKLEVNLGEEVDIACNAKGVPIPFISWKYKVIEGSLVSL